MSQTTTTLNFGTSVSLAQAAALIKHNRDTRFLLQGEPGIGKSSILVSIAEDLGIDYAYIDVPNLDLGDIAMPVVDHTTKTTRYYPNARFKLHEGKPVAVMLDEFTKGVDPVKNMLHPMLEKNNPRLGDVSIHPESPIFLTGNLSSDGVGDSMKAHTRNRIVPITIQKPTSDEWLEWAMKNDVAPEVCAWVSRNPQLMASYTDPSQSDNPYIYNPRKAAQSQSSFVSPRSLHTASSIVKQRQYYEADTLIAALTGAIGEAGSRDLQAFIAFADQLPTWEAIIKHPNDTSVPTSPGACSVVVFGAVQKVTKDSIEALMHYIGRLEPEWQAVFAVQLAKTASKQNIAFASQAFADWVAKNHDIL